MLAGKIKNVRALQIQKSVKSYTVVVFLGCLYVLIVQRHLYAKFVIKFLHKT